ncbi:MAG: glycosyltransferase [Liquorilactobacillus satsumensis]
MNILICTENLIMDGVKRVATVIGNELSRKNTVYYYSLSSDPSFFSLAAPLLHAVHPVNTGKSFREDRPLQRFTQQITDLLTVIKKYKITVVILNAGLFTSFAPVLKQRLPTVKLIAWLHNNYETYLEKYYRQMAPEFIAGLNAVDTVIALTEHDLKKFKQHNQHTLKIYNPVTLKAHGHAKLVNPTIAVVWRLDIQHKGLDLLLNLAALLPTPWQIKVAGDGPEKEALQTAITNQKLSQKIKLTGALNDLQLRKHYQSASLFVMTSRWEGLPLVIGEAMDFGLPIASMWNTGAQEYLQNGQYGILSADHDVASFMHNLSPLLQDLNLRKHWSKLALTRAQAFQLPTIVAQWEELLHKMTPSKSSSF